MCFSGRENTEIQGSYRLVTHSEGHYTHTLVFEENHTSSIKAKRINALNGSIQVIDMYLRILVNFRNQLVKVSLSGS